VSERSMATRSLPARSRDCNFVSANGDGYWVLCRPGSADVFD
jgi:hypothetical protein